MPSERKGLGGGRGQVNKVKQGHLPVSVTREWGGVEGDGGGGGGGGERVQEEREGGGGRGGRKRTSFLGHTASWQRPV